MKLIDIKKQSDQKLMLIDEIRDLHPAFGVEKGWSRYVGGLGDTGEWFLEKLLKASEEELEEFYESLKNPPFKEASPEKTFEEFRDDKEFEHLFGKWEKIAR